jgi:hypothetical protein
MTCNTVGSTVEGALTATTASTAPLYEAVERAVVPSATPITGEAVEVLEVGNSSATTAAGVETDDGLSLAAVFDVLNGSEREWMFAGTASSTAVDLVAVAGSVVMRGSAAATTPLAPDGANEGEHTGATGMVIVPDAITSVAGTSAVCAVETTSGCWPPSSTAGFKVSVTPGTNLPLTAVSAAIDGGEVTASVYDDASVVSFATAVCAATTD